VAALSGYTSCDLILADMTGDNLVEGADIQLFIDALLDD